MKKIIVVLGIVFMMGCALDEDCNYIVNNKYEKISYGINYEKIYVSYINESIEYDTYGNIMSIKTEEKIYNFITLSETVNYSYVINS